MSADREADAGQARAAGGPTQTPAAGASDGPSQGVHARSSAGSSPRPSPGPVANASATAAAGSYGDGAGGRSVRAGAAPSAAPNADPSAATARPGSILRRYPDFRRLFAGNSVSLLGSSVTTVALPLAATVPLHASPAQMGLLGAATLLPHLVLGLPAGVWVDRMPYRRILVVADLAQALLLGAIPLLAGLGLLRIWQLYPVALLAGTGNLFETVTAQSYLPLLVPRRELLPANSALMLSNATVSTSGAALGGLLVSLVTAPVAIAADAFSFVLSALWKARIGTAGPAADAHAGARTPAAPGRRAARTARPAVPERPEPVPARQGCVPEGSGPEPARSDRGSARPGPPRLRTDIAEGLRAVFTHPVVRAVTVAATVGALFGQAQNVVLVLYLVRDVGLPSGLIGLVIAFGGVAAVLGALVATRITRRIGPGRAFIAGMLLASTAGLALAGAAGPPWASLALLSLAQLLRGAGPSLYGINQQTFRQTLIAPHLLSRANATWRFLVFGSQAAGALLGGLAGSMLGLRATLLLSSAAMLGGTALAGASPLRSLRELPPPGS